MLTVRVTLAAFWTATMLTFLLGDVLRLFSGDAVPGEMDGKPATSGMWSLAAIIMLVPIAMVVLSVIVPYPAVRWLSITVAVATIVFNAIGLPYKGAYDNLLIGVSFVLCAAIVWYAWAWRAASG